MANKYRIYDAKNNVILDNVSAPIEIEVEPGKSYAEGDFKWAMIDSVGNEVKKGNVAAFVAKDPTASPASVSVTPSTDSTKVASK